MQSTAVRLPVAAGLLLGFFLLLGGAARMVAYLHYRVLWLDEGYTGLNLATHSLLECFKPLGLYPAVPPGYLAVAKICTLLFGENEYAVRLPSILAGLASLVIFLPAARRWLPGWGGVLGFAYFSTAGLLVYYATEAKPYALDVCIAILLWWLAIETSRNPVQTWRTYLVLGCAGAVGLWFSFPSCFVLAGIATYQIDRCAVRKDLPGMRRLLAAGIPAGLSFSVLFWLFLLPDMRQPGLTEGPSLLDTMHESWHAGFLPFPPHTLAEWALYPSQFFRLFWNPGGFSIRLTGLAAFVWLLGWWSLYKRDGQLFWLMFNPFAVTFAVSLLRLYPFDGRMLLFLTPALFLVLGEGTAFLYENLGAGRRITLVLVILLLLIPATARVARNIVAPPPRNEFDSALDYVRDHWKEGDRLYLGYYDALTYRYCKGWYRFPEDTVITESVPFEQQAAGQREFDRMSLDQLRGHRVWIPVGHHRELENFLGEVESRGGKRVDCSDLSGPKAFAYQF